MFVWNVYPVGQLPLIASVKTNLTISHGFFVSYNITTYVTKQYVLLLFLHMYISTVTLIQYVGT